MPTTSSPNTPSTSTGRGRCGSREDVKARRKKIESRTLTRSGGQSGDREDLGEHVDDDGFVLVLV